MRFSSPWNFLFLSFIPLIILMYILKQKFEERQISSTYLWEQVLKDIDVNTPWQKLKKNILLFLQILAVLFLIFALANPNILIKGSRVKNIIVAIDNTGSMNAKFSDSTRLEAARKKAENLINSYPSGGKITLISLGRHPEVRLSTNDKSEALSGLKSIKPSNSKGDPGEVLSLIRALLKQDISTEAYIYTDTFLDMQGIDGELISLASKSENVSLDYISHSLQDKNSRVLVRATNRGDSQMSGEISLYGDGKLIDISPFDIESGKTGTVYFNNVPSNLNYLSAEITGKDDLLEDNTIYEVASQPERKKALLLTDKNVFLERALSSMSKIELYKANDAAGITEKYDLYIFDGKLPKAIPQEGSIMLINPPDGSGIIKVDGDIEGGISKVQKHSLTRYMESANFTASIIKKIEAPYWADILIKIGENPGVLSGEYKGRKVCIMNFDIHNSDFPLTPEFPIFIYNTIGYLTGSGFEGKVSYISGDSVQVNPLPDAEKATVRLPSGDKENISLKYPAPPFDRTEELGIYELLQNTTDKEIRNMFAVNFPSEDESNINENSDFSKKTVSNGVGNIYGKNIQLFLIILLLAAMVVEWVVYTRGY